MCKLGLIFQEQLKTEIKLLLGANRKSYMARRLAQQRMTSSDHEWPFHASRAISVVAELVNNGFAVYMSKIASAACVRDKTNELREVSYQTATISDTWSTLHRHDDRQTDNPYHITELIQQSWHCRASRHTTRVDVQQYGSSPTLRPTRCFRSSPP